MFWSSKRKLSNKKAICDKDEESEESDVEEGEQVDQLERGPVGQEVPIEKVGHIKILKCW